MNHRERMETCLSGIKMNRVPVALWRHFPVDDQSSDQFAAAVIAFQHQHDFDLVKVTPSSSFCLRDWGAIDQWNGSAEGTRDYTKRVILHPDDWTKLTVLDPHKGSLASELTALQTIVHEMKPHTPVLQTIFSPMAQAKNLVGGEQLLVQMRQYPDALHAGLKVITQSILGYLEAAMDLGIDGIFYAVQHAQYGLLTPSEFTEFGKAYDMQILEACRPLWLNMLHLHGENVMFDEVQTYPV
ncbi:MAG: uroporphyrinogen decarboxylase family protein, partial [Anaerolineaceae bacterium]